MWSEFWKMGLSNGPMRASSPAESSSELGSWGLSQPHSSAYEWLAEMACADLKSGLGLEGECYAQEKEWSE